MSGSVNKTILVGNVGNDPEFSTMQSGDRVCNLNVATSESWKDKSGERKSKTEWHKVVIFNQHLVDVCENYVKKGSKIYIEGQLQTRNWEDNHGVKKYTTEIVLTKFKGELTLLDSKDKSEQSHATGSGHAMTSVHPVAGDIEDEIPFSQLRQTQIFNY